MHLLKKTNTVYGIDKDKRKIQDLKKLRLNFYEKNLYESFIFNLKQKKLLISSNLDNKTSEIYIVCLGAKFENNKINNKDLYKLAQQLGRKLKENDLVILRGTVQLGTTRNIFLKGLKKSTKLICGKDYFLSYMPERLVEGDALAEMETIPTLVSGFSKNCLNNALNFTKFYFNNYLPLNSFEEAEIIKLASNTYRDFKFAFANEISRIANLNNLSGAELIRKANFGYSRNDIPKPSLGVGGFCLPKDPYLFNKSVNNQGNFKLDFNSRKINDNALDQHCKKIKKIFNSKNSLIGKNVLICGIPFKGYPETLDTRNSPALKLGENLKKNNFKLTFIDPLSNMFKNILRFFVPLIAFSIVLGLTSVSGYDVSPLYWYILCVLIQIAAFFITNDKPAITLGVFGILGLISVIIGLITDGTIAIYAFLSAGLFLSIMWPCIFSLSLIGLGKYQTQGSAFLVMMILGGAIIPPIQGKIADVIGIQESFFIGILCFAYLSFFAWFVHKKLKLTEQ